MEYACDRLVQECDFNTTHPNDYALLVRGLPRSTEREIANFFQQPFVQFNKLTREEKFATQTQNQSWADRAVEMASTQRQVVGGVVKTGISETPPAPAEKLSDKETSPSSSSSSSSGSSGSIENVNTNVERGVVRVVVGYDIIKYSKIVNELKSKKTLIERTKVGADSTTAWLGNIFCGCCCCYEIKDNIHEEEVRRREEKIAELTLECENIQSEIDAMADLHESDLKETGVAIVVFETQKQMRDALDFWYNAPQAAFSRRTYGLIKSGCPKFKGCNLMVSRAPNPTEIYWKNLGVSNLERIGRVMATTLIFFLVVLAGAFCVNLLIKWSIQLREVDVVFPEDITDGESFIGWAWSLILSFLPGWLISGINAGMYPLVYAAVNIEVPRSATDRDTAVITKLTAALIMNTTFTYFFVHAIQGDDGSTWFVAGGLLENVFVSRIFAMTFDPVYYAIDPFGRLSRWYARILVRPSTSKMTQEMYEDLWVAPIFPLPEKFAYLVNETIATLVYAPLFPFLCFFSIPVLTLNYWTTKWLLLRHNKRPMEQDDRMGRRTLQMLQVFSAFLPGMTILLLPPLHRNSYIIVILGGVGAFLALFFGLLLPFNLQRNFILIRCFIKDLEYNYEGLEDYYEAQYTFKFDYHQTNPIYNNLPESRCPKYITKNVSEKEECDFEEDDARIGGLDFNVDTEAEEDQYAYLMRKLDAKHKLEGKDHDIETPIHRDRSDKSSSINAPLSTGSL
eukprot:GHVP01011442.1.p1 GENE.GHVP01011442.1~~GHVP01011442.1.p1  ORF type:complete len:737 (-),score=93.83 GHVP01011442.1:661-2871(-)